MKKKVAIFMVISILLVALAVPALAATDNPALTLFKQMMEARKAYIDQEVQGGQLTPEQGQAWKSQIDQMIQLREQNGFFGPGGGPGYCRDGWGGGPSWGSGWQANPNRLLASHCCS